MVSVRCEKLGSQLFSSILNSMFIPLLQLQVTKQQQLVSALKWLLRKDVEDGLLSLFFFDHKKKKEKKSRATALV